MDREKNRNCIEVETRPMELGEGSGWGPPAPVYISNANEGLSEVKTNSDKNNSKTGQKS